MAYNKIFANLPTDLHPIICKYNRKAIHVLPKDQLMTYKWKYLIKAVFGVSYNLPINEMMTMYDSLSKSKNIYCGLSHTIIRLSNGTLMVCGNNNYGQLGLGDINTRLIFEEIKGIPKNVVGIVCGKYHTTIRLSDGTLMTCGNNIFGQLGLNDTVHKLKFQKIRDIPKNVVDVSCGNYHTIIRLSDGTLMACGFNDDGRLGLGDTKYRLMFEEIKNIPKNVVDVSCGCCHTIIRLSDGTLMACGYNNYGQLGLGDTKNRLIFEEIKGIPKNVVDINCGYSHTIIRLSDGTIMACGDNNDGQLGLGDKKNRHVFEEIKCVPKNVVDVSCGNFYTIIRLSDGTLMTCGSNNSGQLGLGDTKKRLIFEEIKDIPKNVFGIVCCGCHTIIRLSNGTLMACGNNDFGQLGLNNTNSRLAFEVIKNIPKIDL